MLRKLFLIFGLLFTGALLWGSSLGRGIGNPSLTWTTGGDPSQPGENVNWSFCTDDDCDGQPCVTSGAGGAGVASSWLKTTVTGPYKISFRYKVQTYRGRFTVECDSRTLYRFSDVTGTNAEWQNAEYEIPAGEHTITFTYVHPGMGYANRFNGVRLSGFKVTPAEASGAEKNDDGGDPLGRGIGNPSLTWTTGGDPSQPGENVNWSLCTDDDCDGQPCVTSGAGGAGVASSWLKTTVTGPCKISFRYKVQTYRGRFTVECDSRTLYRFSDVTGTNAEWQNAEYEIPAGEHTITFTYVHPGMGYANRFNGVRLSGFKVTPAEAPAAEKNDDGGDPLGRGIGNPSLTWTTGGDPSQPGENVNWSFCTDDDCDGQPCVTSGAGGAGVATSWLRTTVTGPCKISFRYKVQTYRGRFTVRCDFRTLYRFSDVTGTNAEWKYAEYEIPPGRHTITFTYRHPGMGYANRFNGVRISGFKVTRE